ncbi:electron transport complex subunit RsxG [Marinomonas mediterranea]|jgi:electron transport complex, RnfABCDGE type, G subunit|uniref:Ion-translocating oxidoreductase complex subunit G n=1 Tax=Marinomonas mediterranea (strain ATCC 700492 / JCM 21426 / NBRC 103028 / MMB-1) TaxID=717774 RepID=F2K0P6_MARM1|nr:electron transport complex subunit RsxG [Marinomonas mediterranea]ADZ92138.1 electron transport complex, RnfABCDGE type, G subunit [Marinomonas mediterranea MMB-1]WCN10104.1 electron transport complex subunit RsxG [Marinomonas mediterranea]WCN14147.1 electron transport complex subunit RsxG [Marinomonas mediterranea]WCN18202.1 electron transport complex subunit RsxG [Marinomonas mediterranea MMB-1]
MELIASIKRNAIGLGIFAVLTAGLIATTHQVTESTIQANIIQAQIDAFNEILPKSRYDNDLPNSAIELAADPLLGSPDPIKAFVAKKDGEVTAIIFETVAPGGYNGNLDLLVSIDRNGVVTGSRVISHKETPGLGDKVDLKKSSWILSFAEKSLANPTLENWRVKKDGGQFDQFTGATITPRAVVRAVKNTLIYFDKNKAELLSH